jgi:branched-chain amino acid transport system substrate-binding protein
MTGRDGGSSRRLPAKGLMLLVVGAIALAACGSSKSDSTTSTAAAPAASGTDTAAAAGGSGGTITIGHLATCEGPFAGFYHSMVNGSRLALLEAGGTLEGDPSDLKGQVTGVKVGGKEIKLVYECSDATPDKATAAVRRLVEQDHVDIVQGPLSGDEGIAVKEYAKTHPEMVFIDGGSGAQATTLNDPAPNFYRFHTEGTQWMAGLGSYAYNKLGWRNVVTIADDYGFPYSQVAGFLAEFCSLGGTIEKKVWPPLGTTDYSSYASQIPTSGIDGFFMAIGGSGTLSFLNAYQGIKADEKLADKMIGGTITVDPDLLKGLGDRVEGVVTAGPTPPDSTAPAWTTYAALSNQYFPDEAPSSIFYIAWYDGMKVLINALKQVNGDLSNNQQALKDNLAKTQYDSPGGKITLDQNRAAVAANYVTQVVKGTDGSFTQKTVWTLPPLDQTFGGVFSGSTPQPSRDFPTCEKRDPPPWVGNEIEGPPTS